MKIFTVRDRMLDYFVLPAFFAPTTEQATAMIAAAVNGETKDALCQAPHHFELWELGNVEEKTGRITESREFVAECASFIRSRVRETAASGRGQIPDPNRRPEAPPGANGEGVRATNGTGAHPPQGQGEPPPQTAQTA